ncbi:MAG: hypothetical protein QW521_05490 [Desulfurococcaceae archaeon]
MGWVSLQHPGYRWPPGGSAWVQSVFMGLPGCSPMTPIPEASRVLPGCSLGEPGYLGVAWSWGVNVYGQENISGEEGCDNGSSEVSMQAG